MFFYPIRMCADTVIQIGNIFYCAMMLSVRRVPFLGRSLFLPLIFPFALMAQDPGAEVKVMQAIRAATPPVIDGYLDEEVWTGAAMVDDFHQISPDEYEKPSESTVIYLIYSIYFIYFIYSIIREEGRFISYRRDGRLDWFISYYRKSCLSYFRNIVKYHMQFKYLFLQ